jgi:hypothetical protein
MIVGTATDLEIRYGNGRISPPVNAEMQRWARNNVEYSGVKAEEKFQPLKLDRARCAF